MESFVQLSVKEYEDLKQRAERQDIPVEISNYFNIIDGNGKIIETSPATININMRELKLQICRQHGIDPETSVVEFY